MSVAEEEIHDTEIVERDFIPGTALESINKSEIDIQISTAKRYPRSLKQFNSDAMAMACMDEETAGSMFYVLPRAGKRIEGPSVRLAEVVGSCWGNLRYGSRIVDVGDRFVTAQGMCMDLQKNIAASVEVQMRITNKEGVRYGDDMIQTTCNAASSKALRGAIFKVVPFAFIKPIYEAARRTSVGNERSFTSKRDAAIEWFAKAGATWQQVIELLGKPGIADITTDDLITLGGLKTAIQDGDTTVDQVFAGTTAPGPKKAKPSALNEKLNQKPAAPADAQSAVQKMKERFELAQTAEDAKALLDEYTGPESSYPEDVINLSSAAYDKATARLSGKGSKQKNLV